MIFRGLLCYPLQMGVWVVFFEKKAGGGKPRLLGLYGVFELEGL